MRFFPNALLALLVLGSSAVGSSAVAEDLLPVTWRKVEMLTLSGAPGSIVIGDPSVIDVTIEPSGLMLVFGKEPGETNMIVFDGSGKNILFNGAVVVAPESNRHVSIVAVTQGSIVERTWNCVERCVQVIGPGSIPYKAVVAEAGQPAQASAGSGQSTQQAAASTAGSGGAVPSVTTDNSAGAGGGIAAPY